MNSYEIRLLSNDFYNDYNLTNYPEMEDKSNRPFLVMLIKTEENIFAIPFRTKLNMIKLKKSKRLK